MGRFNQSRGLQLQAWEYGRSLFNGLVDQFRDEYGMKNPPPPALIIDELLTDFLKVELRFHALPPNRHAQTDWIDGKPVVTVNSLINEIPGVGDVQGVENLSKFHEGIHVARDLHILKSGSQAAFPGFETPKPFRCYRSATRQSYTSSEEWKREFWAEEAGRAAAISHAALAQSEAFRALTKFAILHSSVSNAESWRLLGHAARDIGVNPTALVKQLRLEGWITIETQGGRKILQLQPRLNDWLEASK